MGERDAREKKKEGEERQRNLRFLEKGKRAGREKTDPRNEKKEKQTSKRREEK